MLWRNWVFLNGTGGSRKGEKMCKMTQEVGSHMWTEYEHWCAQIKGWVWVIAEKLNMSRETMWQNVKENLGKRKIPAKMVPQINVGFTFHPIFYAMQRCLIGSLPVMKLKNTLKGQRFADLSDQRENITARYSRKRFSRLFPAVAPSYHKVHSFTRRVFQRCQQPLVHR